MDRTSLSNGKVKKAQDPDKSEYTNSPGSTSLYGSPDGTGVSEMLTTDESAVSFLTASNGSPSSESYGSQEDVFENSNDSIEEVGAAGSSPVSAESGYDSRLSPILTGSAAGSGASSAGASLEPAVTKPDAKKAYKIVQTREELTSNSERDRAKRFDFLLKQTELWGHFLQPAYQEALNFAPGDKTAATSKKRKGAVFPLPTNSADDATIKRTDAPKHKNHFDSSPWYIEGGAMRDYQIRGLNWMISLAEKGISGILADEMGLGKTIQTISLLGYMKHYKEKEGPHLIIAPKSTLPNWMNELKRWCPTLKAICLIGGKEERGRFLRTTFRSKQWNVCVTSYEMARIEAPTLSRTNFHYVVIDEAQKIKNEHSLLSIGVRRFKSQARLLLTGTPLQNNLHELWALLNFLLPDVFSSSEDFDSWFNESNCIGNQSLVDRLHAVLRPFLLRRVKSDVEKSLLPKTELRLYVQMTPMQREWYRKILLNDIEVINKSTGKTGKKAIFNIIMQLRKVCNHPYLFEGAEPQPFTTDSHLVTNCGKMIVLDKLLPRVKAQGSRVLLFCQMTRMLDILEDYCIWRNLDYCRLDGDTDYDIRQEDIDAFNAPNSSKFIYLLSTRAGGLGINLATADVVILYDSDWNPMADLQAMDRAHRIGQKKQVRVFRFVVQDTAEEKIVERAAAKLHLDRMVIQQGRLVGTDDKNKKPDAAAMLNVVRFGAEKILKSGSNEGVTDADIDKILAQSKVKSDELDRHLNGMKEDNLRELTIEQVEFKWEKPSEESSSAYNFEGKDYRELRKRKKISQHAVDSQPEGIKGRKRRNEVSQLGTPARAAVYDSDSSYEPSDVESDGRRTRDVTPNPAPSPMRRPAPPLDFQFCPPYIWELYWRKVDNIRKVSSDFKLNHLSGVVSSQDIQTLVLAEEKRIRACSALSSIESREILMLKHEGFASWKKKHFKQFLDAIREHGMDNLEAVAAAISGKEVEDVVRYSQVFWMRCHELMNFEEVMRKLNRPDFVKERRAKQQDLLLERIQNAKSVSDVEVKYQPHHWMGQRFSVQDDVQLLITISEIGMSAMDVFEVLRSKLAESQSETSQFLRSRTKEELQHRFNLLIYMIEMEGQTEPLSASKRDHRENLGSASVIQKSMHKLAVKNLMEQKAKTTLSPECPELSEGPSPKKQKVADSTTDDLLF